MARIDWVKQRLENWALWKARSDSNGLGYARSSILLALGGTTNGSRESIIPVDEVEASRTDKAVESLKLRRSHLYLALQLFYVKGHGIKQTARIMCRAESTVKAQLAEADAAIAQWFNDNKPPPAPGLRPAGSFTP